MAYVAIANRNDENDPHDMLAYALVAIGATEQEARDAVGAKIAAAYEGWGEDEESEEADISDWLIVVTEA